MSPIRERLAALQERIAAAARKAGRDPASVRLVGAAKAQPVESIVEACRAGLRDVGENFAQEAKDKVPEVERRLSEEGIPSPRWHFIGQLQSNKVRSVISWVDCVSSLDRPSLARELDRRATSAGRSLDCLIQVNLSGEDRKGGVSAETLPELLERCTAYPALRIVGLLTVPEPTEDPEDARPRFAELRALLERHRRSAGGALLRHLSMGMSHDFEVAIEEGATEVRLGTAIFGPREVRR